MSLQGHASSIKRHLQNSHDATDQYKKDQERKYARIAYERMQKEASKLSDKQIMRDSPEAYNMLKNGVSGL